MIGGLATHVMCHLDLNESLLMEPLSPAVCGVSKESSASSLR